MKARPPVSLLIGIRLLRGAGRAGLARFLLMSLGCAMGVACLAAVLTIPAILSAHDSRAAAREPQPVTGALHTRSADDTVFLTRQDPYGSQPFTRIFVGRPAGAHLPPPPGIDHLPGAGEVLVSPRLREVLAAQPGLAGLLPGRVAGTIGPAGLTGPDELYAYIGRAPGQLPASARPLAGFGSKWAPTPAVDSSTLDILRFALVCLVLLPLAVFLSVCARLSAEARARRLAALRLLGLSVKDTLRVNAVETVAAALLGAGLGVGVYALANEVLAEVGLPGLQWYPPDGRPTTTVLAVCLIGCPGLAWFVGRHRAREAATRPLQVRRGARPRPPKKYGLLLLLPGLGVVCGYCVLGVLGHDPSEGPANAVFVPVGVLLTGAGLVLALAPVTAWLARRLAGTTQSLPMALAMRRNEVEPSSSLRVVTGLVLLVYAASLAQGLLVELAHISRPTSSTQEYALPLGDLSESRRIRMGQVEGVKGQAVAMSSWVPDAGSSEPRITAVVADCAQLAAFSAVPPRGCVDGRVQRLTDPEVAEDPAVRPGRSYPFLLSAGGRAGDTEKFRVTLPRDALVIQAHQPSAFVGADVLIPPSALPAGRQPATGSFLLLSDSAPDTVRAVLDGLGTLAPTAEVEAVGVNVEALQQITVVKSLLAAGMVLGRAIGVAAFAVSAADRAMERRGRLAMLNLLGARPLTVRAAQCIQVLLPLAVGLVGALVAGRLAESSYLITGGGTVHWDAEGLPLLVACTVGILLTAALASLPLTRRHVEIQHIRRD
ncbi:FtsX-like permease family protein [Streptomyces drozdowiczii]|uniref:ABC transporter permease n=1 Tax=Streptomyces drozdowiczii TaxID=202862 RepID=A0ABY6PU76_9ACTN|nr:FtsX-like permease family protein [Streptomyces drozdowiczii]MCX0244657.1 ABC transporter permease [Streptomyces drozdowiczii]UZK55602.1 ABC transporter permease [Streptomyces drozdowiczii]